MTQKATDPLSLISWNIHRARGNDGQVNPTRVVDVLAREVWSPNAELLALKEADTERAPIRGLLHITAVEAATGLRWIHHDPQSRSGPDSHGFLGVVLFAPPQWQIEDIRLVDLPGHCPRGAVVLDALRNGQPLRIIATHLSLSQMLRLVQLRTIRQHLNRFDDRPTTLCGDLNEWRPWGGLALSRYGLGGDFHGPAKASFPINRPVLPLDRVLTKAPARVAEVEVLDGPGIRATSDHRPIRATVRLSR